jgi:4-amino-4-deoxy-L-arabinose transferase-like glycosyltransferase
MAVVYKDQLDPNRGFWLFGYETGKIARSIASGDGFANPLFEKTGPTAWMTPLYPYLVAAVFRLTGVYSKTSAIILLSLNCLFSAFTCVPVFFIARKTFGEKAAVWSAWAWALFPYAIYFSVEWIWETCLTTLLLSLLFLFTLRLEDTTRLRQWLGYGLLWGVTALSNPSVLTLLPIFVVWACYRLRKNGRRWGGQPAVAMLAMIIVVAPWFVRNYRTFHQFIPFRDAFWLVMHVGNNGDTSHWAPDSAHPSTNAMEEQEFNRLGELNYMAEKRREVLQVIRSHPGSYVWLTLRRFIFAWTGFWSISRDYLAIEPGDPWNILMTVILLVLMLTGLWRTFRDGNEHAILYASVLVVFPLIYYFSFTQMSYRHPIDPFVAILAAYGAMNLVPGRRQKRLAEGNDAKSF